ncbi:hypothetical protein PHYPSEUDO_004066 [Phytophthora pseudosyringae]|uniref:Uncharacterized protein n=1 Tax=Phytophthora pseudosyringae TaxID=221518 RepID=A0A8T1VP39_9STRA|nr:hypothetical protein PHYPSEUDO_004066 [Phytophthora pseudosyringae]
MVTSSTSGGGFQRAADPAARPPMQRSTSIDSRPSQPVTRCLRRCASGLSHGLQMDVQQAVQLEKQELQKRGLLPPPFVAGLALPKAPAGADEEHNCSSYWLYRQQRRAVCRSNGQQPAVPCSPPVPIPLRRYSAAGGLGEHAAHGVDAEQLQRLSRSQCEARLWDKFWNYKLSFEARESFEAANVGATGGRARASSDHVDERRTPEMALRTYRSEASATSATDTGNEDDVESVSPEDEDEHVRHYSGDVFEMDDL